MKKLLLSLLILFPPFSAESQSVAREWNEEVLNAIRNDFARPTVHARNLFHTSVAMYEAWSTMDDISDTFLLGKTVGEYICPFDGFSPNEPVEEAREKAISYAVYRLILHRFADSPGFDDEILPSVNALMGSLGYDINYTNVNYSSGNAADLGNFIAQELIAFGFQDGSNELDGYQNQFYEPVNEPLVIEFPGNPDIEFPNRWQPLTLDVYIDQSGNIIPLSTPDFLSPEWGQVVPFALKEEDLTIYGVSDYDYFVYHDPGAPHYIQEGLGIDDPYKWNFSLVSTWSSHLDPTDGVMIDTSPATIGNIQWLPTTFEEYKLFYDLLEGGDASEGHALNPATGAPYEPQVIPRGDYTRVLAEFWADGPDSETPPGHWFTILNYVNDNPLLEKRFGGEGDILSDLEWDVKTYFVLGGAMHDVAITAWGIKGYYDYIRPISALRYMADQGQSTDMSLPNYNPHGVPLIEDYIETVEAGDPLEGDEGEHIGKIKIKAWLSPNVIEDPTTQIAGVDWMLAENWFPYQRISFVTPPFAGYISGHSTYSRAAAVVLSSMTGDPFFPGGMGVFDFEANNYLVFEAGPSVSMQLQWATYQDASDQCSLSRIWGGIHPPIDDIPGRVIGQQVGEDAFAFASAYISGEVLNVADVPLLEPFKLFPIPAKDVLNIQMNVEVMYAVTFLDSKGRTVLSFDEQTFNGITEFDVSKLASGFYFVVFENGQTGELISKKIIKN
tara:strand:- start:30418 stop:32595 length:2178 start_codon:yes stop_codon:yes gene_type:complete